MLLLEDSTSDSIGKTQQTQVIVTIRVRARFTPETIIIVFKIIVYAEITYMIKFEIFI